MIVKNIVIGTVIGVLLTAGSTRAQELNVEQIVRQKIQPILPKNGEGGGVAVAVRMGGKTQFFNYGFADNAQNRPVTADSNLQSRLCRKGVRDDVACASRETGRAQLGRPGCQVRHRVTTRW